jgi:hypothetical protein
VTNHQNWVIAGAEALQQSKELNRLAEPLGYSVIINSDQHDLDPRFPGWGTRGEPYAMFFVRRKDEAEEQGQPFGTAEAVREYLDDIAREST